MVSQHFRSALQDVRSFRGADCDSDHNLVSSKLKIKLKTKRKERNERREKIDTEKLNDNTIKSPKKSF